MELSPIGRAVLIAREGRRLEAYRDSVGVWTIGVGHTSAAGPPAVRPGLTLTAAECDALFTRDVARYAATVRDAVPGPLPEHAFDALVSLCFNIGPSAFLRSSVLRRLRAGDPDAASEAILMWNRPPAIIPRRQGEYDQFRTPYATALPRARRSDARPIAPPAACGTRLAEGPARPVSLPPQRRPTPRPTAPQPASTRTQPVAPAAGLAATLGRLWARLRARFRGPA